MEQANERSGRPPRSSPLYAAALALAERGRPVFPAGRDKRPKTTNGLLDATTDPDVIRTWWSRWPQANVAIRTGEPSGLVVLDTDGQEGADSLHELERQHGELPLTASVKTPRGGEHSYFHWPGIAVKTTASVIAPSVDVRGDGAYALVPPSITAAGRYEWDEWVPLAAMPAWLVDLTRADGGVVGATPAATDPAVWVAMVCDGIADGTRKVDLARLAGYLLRRYVAVDLTAALVHLVNTECCRPSKPAADVDRIVDSISRSELRRRETRP